MKTTRLYWLFILGKKVAFITVTTGKGIYFPEITISQP